MPCVHEGERGAGGGRALRSAVPKGFFSCSSAMDLLLLFHSHHGFVSSGDAFSLRL